MQDVNGVWTPERNRAIARAHSRAKQRLIELHRTEYEALLTLEKAREGIEPLPPSAQS